MEEGEPGVAIQKNPNVLNKTADACLRVAAHWRQRKDSFAHFWMPGKGPSRVDQAASPGAVMTGNSEEYCTKTVRRSFPDKFNQGK